MQKIVRSIALALPLLLVAAVHTFAQAPPPVVVGSRGYIDHTAQQVHTSGPFDSRGASTLVAFVSTHPLWNDLPVAVDTLTDSAGNTWQLLTGPTTFQGMSFTLVSSIYYVNAPNTAANHTLSVTLTNAAPLVIHAFAVSGSDIAAAPLYSAITDSGFNTPNASVASAPIVVPANSLLLSWVKNDSVASAVPVSHSGFTIDAQSSTFLWAESRQTTSGGTFTGQFLYNNAITWQTAIVGLTALNGPAAHDQSVTTEHDTPMGITLTATSYAASPITYAVLDGPSHGSLSGTAPNLTYTPDPAYTGSDAFTFDGTDSSGTGNPAIVRISVRANNHAPVASTAAVSILGPSGAITLPATDADGDPLTYTIVTPPVHGTLSAGTGAGRIYTPAAGYLGTDSFTFKANDGRVDSNVALIDVAVQTVAQAPTIVARRGYAQPLPQLAHTTAPFDTTGASTLVAFVSTHPNWNNLPIGIGGLSDSASNTWHVLTGPTSFDSDHFTLTSAIYYVNAPTTSAAHTLTVTLTNPAPVVIHVFAIAGSDITGPPVYSPITDPGAGWMMRDVQSASITVPTNSLLLSWAKNDSEASASALGGFALDPESAGFLWAESKAAPVAGAYAGHFEYDAIIGWQTAIVGVRAPGGPLSYGQSLTTNHDTPVGVTLVASSPISLLAYLIVTPPAHGQISGTGASRTYTPDASFVGNDSFTFKTNDGLLDSNLALVTIAVQATAPVINSQPATQTVSAGQTATFIVDAAGVPAPAVAWQRFDTTLSQWVATAGDARFGGSATASLVVAATATGSLDHAQFRVVVTNSAGSVTSNAATLLVPTVCDYSVSTAPLIYDRGGATQSLIVTAPASCVWAASSTSAWVVMPAGGSGTMTIALTVGPNFGAQARQASVTIAGHAISISQPANALPVLFDPGLTNEQVVPFNFNGDAWRDLVLYNQVTGSWMIKVGAPGGSFEDGPSGVWAPGWQISRRRLQRRRPRRSVPLLAGERRLLQGHQQRPRALLLLRTGMAARLQRLHRRPQRRRQVRCLRLQPGERRLVHLHQQSATAPPASPISRARGRTTGRSTRRTSTATAAPICSLYSRVSGVYYKVISAATATRSPMRPRRRAWAPDWTPFIVDLNGDGRSDVFLYDAGNGVWYRAVSTGDGTGGFDYTVGPWAPGWQVQAADFDGDGRSDLFLYSPTSGVFYKVVNTGSTFVYSSGVWAQWTPAVMDLDGDGRSDVLLLDRGNGVWYQALTLAPGTFAYTQGQFR